MSIVPERDNSTFINALLAYKMFSPETHQNPIEFIYGGYMLCHKFDQTVWGSGSLNALLLFQDSEMAENVAHSLGNNWEIKEVVCADVEDLQRKEHN